jgi:hypothetical protein
LKPAHLRRLCEGESAQPPPCRFQPPSGLFLLLLLLLLFLLLRARLLLACQALIEHRCGAWA